MDCVLTNLDFGLQVLIGLLSCHSPRLRGQFYVNEQATWLPTFYYFLPRFCVPKYSVNVITRLQSQFL